MRAAALDQHQAGIARQVVTTSLPPRRLHVHGRRVRPDLSAADIPMQRLALILAIASLAACADRAPANPAPQPSPAQEAPASDDSATPASDPPTTPPTPADAAKTEADYLGRWIGVEGMVLVVAAKPGGGVTLDMQWDLDHRGTFDGSVTAEGLRFIRNGVAESAVHTDGDATGLKHLAGKRDCLTVKAGEGYCRD